MQIRILRSFAIIGYVMCVGMPQQENINKEGIPQRIDALRSEFDMLQARMSSLESKYQALPTSTALMHTHLQSVQAQSAAWQMCFSMEGCALSQALTILQLIQGDKNSLDVIKAKLAVIIVETKQTVEGLHKQVTDALPKKALKALNRQLEALKQRQAIIATIGAHLEALKQRPESIALEKAWEEVKQQQEIMETMDARVEEVKELQGRIKALRLAEIKQRQERIPLEQALAEIKQLQARIPLEQELAELKQRQERIEAVQKRLEEVEQQQTRIEILGSQINSLVDRQLELQQLVTQTAIALDSATRLMHSYRPAG